MTSKFTIIPLMGVSVKVGEIQIGLAFMGLEL